MFNLLVIVCHRVCLFVYLFICLFVVIQHWSVYMHINELFILIPALLGLKGNLEMTLASRLSTAVSLVSSVCSVHA